LILSIIRSRYGCGDSNERQFRWLLSSLRSKSDHLAEYHIRYGSWGGIGYYHVSDRYIAPFSRFILCGVWEGSYIYRGRKRGTTKVKPARARALRLRGLTEIANPLRFVHARSFVL